MSLRKFFHRRRQDEHRAEEMQAHLEFAIQDLIDRGMTRDAATREARLRFGNPRSYQERVSDMNRLPLWDVLGLDLRYGVRVLRRTPVFTMTVAGTLALVIGANMAVFSIADQLLLRPLPFPNADRLALAQSHRHSPATTDDDLSIDGRMWEAIRDHVMAADSAAFVGGAAGVNFSAGGRAAFVQQERVGAGFFHVLGIAPQMGREFTVEEDRPGGPRVAVLSDGLWRRAFGGDRSIVGGTVTLRGEAYQVIGIMPAGTRGTDSDDVDVWTPLRASTRGEGANNNYECVMRLRQGATWTELATELRAISSPGLFASLGRLDSQDDQWLSAFPMQTAVADSSRQPLILLGAAVIAVLIIACVNIASLFLARGSARARELATRMALGSGRRAVIRQLMVESLLVAAIGGVMGLALGALGLDGLKQLAGSTFVTWRQVSIDGRVVAMTAALTIATGLMFGLVPAWQASRLDVQRGLAEGGSRAVAGAAKRWGRRSLVVIQVALGVVLLVGAGLLIRTFLSLSRLDPGFDGGGVTTASVSLQDARYVDGAVINQLFERSVAALEATPGVSAAAVTLELPYKRLLNLGAALVDSGAASPSRMVNLTYVTPDFVRTFGMRLMAGRELAPADRAGAPPVVLVNESFARLYSPDRDVIGRRVKVAGDIREIVGVVNNVQQKQSFFAAGMTRGPITTLPAVFAPASQLSSSIFNLVHQWFRPVWSVRTTSVDVSRALRAAIAGVDPQLPVAEVQTMAQVRGEALGQQRMLMTLVGIVAAAAVMLLAMGLYGLVAHDVGERRREFGIRLALGATRTEAVRAVSSTGILLALAGGAIGVALAVPASRLVAAFLWGVTPADVVTYAMVVGFVLLVAALASITPALTLLRLDPANTLRE